MLEADHQSAKSKHFLFAPSRVTRVIKREGRSSVGASESIARHSHIRELSLSVQFYKASDQQIAQTPYRHHARQQQTVTTRCRFCTVPNTTAATKNALANRTIFKTSAVEHGSLSKNVPQYAQLQRFQHSPVNQYDLKLNRGLLRVN